MTRGFLLLMALTAEAGDWHHSDKSRVQTICGHDYVEEAGTADGYEVKRWLTLDSCEYGYDAPDSANFVRCRRERPECEIRNPARLDLVAKLEHIARDLRFDHSAVSACEAEGVERAIAEIRHSVEGCP